MRPAGEPDVIGAGAWARQAGIVVGFDTSVDQQGGAALMAGSCSLPARRESPNNVGGMW